MSSKKAISPIVATALLLIVTVISVIGFQNWFNTFQTSVQSDIETNNQNQFNIETIVSGFLYLNGVAEIQSVKVNGNDCHVSGLTNENLNTLAISNCTSIGVNEIVIVTNNGVISKKIVNNLPYTDPCPQGYILVPGNIELGTKNFCVMKYEAKAKNKANGTIVFDGCNGAGLLECKDPGNMNWASLAIYEAASVEEGAPWRKVTWNKAKEACENLGSNYKLITDNEWLTIARDISLEPENWDGGIVGINNIPRGFNRILSGIYSDYYPAPNGTENCKYVYGNGGNVICSSTGDFGDRRTLQLSTGEEIWDLAGNVWEWTDEWIYSSSAFGSPYRYHGGSQEWMSYHSDDGTGKNASNVPYLKLPLNGWNSLQGMGRYFDGCNGAGLLEC
ncbi:hypothetical protein EOM09_04255, partial [bacterium]|nr:hypothetical protein [bacterium]